MRCRLINTVKLLVCWWDDTSYTLATHCVVFMKILFSPSSSLSVYKVNLFVFYSVKVIRFRKSLCTKYLYRWWTVWPPEEGELYSCSVQYLRSNTTVFEHVYQKKENSPQAWVTFTPIHSEFVRLFFLQTHLVTDRFFAVSGVHLPPSTSGHFRNHHTTFSSRIKSRVGKQVTL